MNDTNTISYMRGFVPYALAAFLIGLVGGLTTVLGPAFVQDMNLPYNNTTWTALALALSSAVGAPILGRLSDVLGRRSTLLIGLGIFVFGNVLTAIFMKIVLSDLPDGTAGSGTGIYGLFRDLAAPFGVAVFVPLFTNRITRLAAASGISAASAAVSSIRTLGLIELCCVGVGIIIVQFLPRIHQK